MARKPLPRSHQRKRRHAPPGWTEERKERLRQQRSQKAKKEAERRKPGPVTVTRLDGTEVNPPKSPAKSDYDRYIRSEKWGKRKAEYYRQHDKICWRCGSKRGIHLHHHTYLRMGSELNEDLVPLCQECHQRAHNLHKLRSDKDLTQATIEAIAEHPDHKDFKVVLVL